MAKINTKTIFLTYDNFEVMNNEQQRQMRENYRQGLLNQIQEITERKKKKKKEEEKQEELEKKEKNYFCKNSKKKIKINKN